MRIHSRRRLSYGTFRRTYKQRLDLFLEKQLAILLPERRTLGLH